MKDADNSSKWIKTFMSFLQSIYFEKSVKQSNTSNILSKIKNGISRIIKKIINYDKSKMSFPELIPEIDVIKL